MQDHAVAEFPAEHIAIADSLIAEMRANDGLVDVDIETFWQENKRALADPFDPTLLHPGFHMFNPAEAVFTELGVEEDFWKYDQDEAYRLDLNKRYNDKAERIIGKRVLGETPSDPNKPTANVKQLHDVFEAKNVWSSGSWWLEQVADTPGELEALLDRVDARDIRATILPDDWETRKQQLKDHGMRLPAYRGQRGPVTFATSIYGAENFLMLLIDQPELAERLRDTILRVMLEIADVLDEEAGLSPDERRRGFAFMDDNCALLNPELYATFGQPILKAVYDRFSPDPTDTRFQHSDSAMEHLLGELASTGMTRVNFGPTVSVKAIRQAMPNAVIEGRIAPFTLGRNDERAIVCEVLRDIEDARETRGLCIATAGSIVTGTRLTGLRLVMATIQRYGAY